MSLDLHQKVMRSVLGWNSSCIQVLWKSVQWLFVWSCWTTTKQTWMRTLFTANNLQCSVTGYVHSVLLFMWLLLLFFFLCFIDVFHFLTLHTETAFFWWCETDGCWLSSLAGKRMLKSEHLILCKLSLFTAAEILAAEAERPTVDFVSPCKYSRCWATAAGHCVTAAQVKRALCVW